MTDGIQLPSAEEAEQLSQRFDRVASRTLRELAGRRIHERLELIMQKTSEGLSSPVRAGATVYVGQAVEDDPEVSKYDDPTDEELREVLAKADGYDGQWYHSRVVLNFYGSWTPLQRQVAELDEDSGVFIVFNYRKHAPRAENM